MKKVSFFLIFFLSAPLFGAERFTLKELQGLVLKENPKIRSMELEAAMMKTKISQSSSLDDPRLKLGLNNIPTNSFSLRDEDMSSKEIGISQMIPLGGKLAVKEDIALIEYKKAIERLRKEKIEMLKMTGMAVYDLLYIRSSISIVEEIKNSLELLVQSEIAANKTGMSSLANVVKSNIEYTMIDEELISLKQQEKELLHKLGYLAGRDVDITETSLNEPEFKDFNLNEVKEKILTGNPDIALLKLDEDISKKEVVLKEKEYYPDVELGFSYMQRDNAPSGMKRPDMVSAMATINIPLWYKKKNIPMITEMQRKREMTEKLIGDKKNALSYRAETLLSQLRKWRELYSLYNGQLVPQAQIAFEALLAKYKTSTGEFMPMIDTVRILLRYKKETLMTKREYLSTLAELDALVGTELAP